MDKFKHIISKVIPLDRSNVDTDAIIPKQFLKSIKRTGFGPNLFDEWRYLDHGEPGMDNSKRSINPDFVLNKPQFKDSKILLVRENFGCGSSREHAPWALLDFGIKVIIAESFADIFYNNCFKNGILPITLQKDEIEELFSETATKTLEIEVNLEKQFVKSSKSYSFEIDEFKKSSLLNGLDEIGLTLENKSVIANFEKSYFSNYPWLKQE
ncbi:3-isopropylmalate dehydratase [Methylophilales bacterium MBRSG12]|uniref:3-isopropylmalate dehydratase small subunit n=1 Tax=Methylophilales bacterium MBRS-H7 TaxID=1623450 RepID=A0A0H4IZW6_9PROT|nr:3-isopropylmalate dehydratase [Methylophilales bacterium MBRSF5]AKO65320.1 3-isopropylmalate dehydratase [Methylophilales bacterium MBRS-H7]AKO66639.1 3-isopropylmalate dehydratase [Methylophilales bacterium MBRSG12]